MQIDRAKMLKWLNLKMDDSSSQSEFEKGFQSCCLLLIELIELETFAPDPDQIQQFKVGDKVEHKDKKYYSGVGVVTSVTNQRVYVQFPEMATSSQFSPGKLIKVTESHYPREG